MDEQTILILRCLFDEPVTSHEQVARNLLALNSKLKDCLERVVTGEAKAVKLIPDNQ